MEIALKENLHSLELGHQTVGPEGRIVSVSQLVDAYNHRSDRILCSKGLKEVVLSKMAKASPTIPRETLDNRSK